MTDLFISELVMNDDICRALELLPRNLKIRTLENLYIIVVLSRNGGNRTYTAAELGMPLRTLRKRLGEIREVGYDIPPYVYQHRKKPT